MARKIRKKTNQGQYLAYTLTELLIVIAILAVLAGILFPAFASAKVQSMKASATSNLEQVFRTSTLYSNDFDDRVPYAVGECEWHGGCGSLLDEDFWSLIQSNHIPSFTMVLKPYGFEPRLFQIEAGSGPRLFKQYGSSYSYALGIASGSLRPLETHDCPYFVERGTDVWEEGQSETRLDPGGRWLTLYFDGHIHFDGKDMFTKGDYCRDHFRQ